jgi:release factor glutamine methyltransferase
MLEPEVVDHEPHVALFAPGDGMAVFRRLVRGAAQALTGGGLLAVEIGETQGERVAELLRSGPWLDVRIEKDLAGRDRYAVGRRRED